LSALLLAACGAPVQKPKPAPAKTPPAIGLVALPCDGGPLRPHAKAYCLGRRNYVTAPAQASLLTAAEALRAAHPGSAVTYMEASWPLGRRPMPPHLSHGDGRQVDLALLYTDLDGRPLPGPPTLSGYGAYEPPARERDRACTGKSRRAKRNDGQDPPANRAWRLDEARTAALVRILSADPKVRRIFLEPHLKRRLGLGMDRKVRFAGCQAARHDDHIHVDFF